MLVGEAPGREEFMQGEPFVGKSGEEQEWYLQRRGRSASDWYRTNVVKEYREGNPDPTKSQVDEWTSVLEDEVWEEEPELIVAVGRFAARWFLGDEVDMDLVHGIPHFAGAFDPQLSSRGGPMNAIVLPVYHPAAGFYDNDMKAVIDWDYGQVCDVLEKIERGESVGVRADAYEGKEQYEDVSGEALMFAALGANPEVVAIDTEGTPNNPWSIQVSWVEGGSYVLRHDRADFQAGIDALQHVINSGALTVMHNALYDIEMCEAMGLDLSRARIWDTMYAAYLMRLEPQGLKPLAWRWCGMKMMGSYRDVVRGAAAEAQVKFLESVAARKWDRPDPRVIRENNGVSRIYQPQAAHVRAKKIINDYRVSLVDESKPVVDLEARWKAMDDEIAVQIENEPGFGAFPLPTLSDVSLDEAVLYSARDSDATLRLYYRLRDQLAVRGLTRTMDLGMTTLPIFEEMQRTGMPASRKAFEELFEECEGEVDRLGARLSLEFYGGKPFNPMSRRDVTHLLMVRGLEGELETPTGAMSTSKKSIEHLRYEDPAVALVFDWREAQHVRDSFCKPILAKIPKGADYCSVRCSIKTTRTATRRLASTDPNLLAIPVRKDLGRKVRGCFRCEPGWKLGAWDLSQIEMRYLAHESEDELLCELFNEGRDVHTETAARIFNVPLDEVDKMTQRLPAKNAGFGIVYGIAGPGLMTQLRMLGLTDWAEEGCEGLIRGWLNVYSGVKRYIRRSQDELADTGVVVDYWGMPRYVPGIWSPDHKMQGEAARIAVSHKVQGGAQGMIQNSMAWLKPRIEKMREGGAKVKWCLQIHDEIVLKFEEGLWGVLNGLVLEALTEHHGRGEMLVPILAEGAVADSWGELK